MPLNPVTVNLCERHLRDVVVLEQLHGVVGASFRGRPESRNVLHGREQETGMLVSSEVGKYEENTAIENDADSIRDAPGKDSQIFVRGAHICNPWTFRENHSPNIIFTS